MAIDFIVMEVAIDALAVFVDVSELSVDAGETAAGWS